MFKQYLKNKIAEMRPYVEGESMDHISIAEPDKKEGSPKVGDMIARNPTNHEDQWLVSEKFFNENYVET